MLFALKICAWFSALLPNYLGSVSAPPRLTIGDKLRAAIRTSRSTMTLNGQKNGDPSITTFPAARQLDPLVERRSDCGYSLKKRGKTVELLALAKPLRSQHDAVMLLQQRLRFLACFQRFVNFLGSNQLVRARVSAQLGIRCTNLRVTTRTCPLGGA